MFTRGVMKMYLLAALLVLLVAGIGMFFFRAGDEGHAVHPWRNPGVRKAGRVAVDQESAVRVPFGFDRKKSSSEPDDEFAPEVMTDDPTVEIAVPDLSDIPGADAGELCRRLGLKIRAGESPETVAIAAELVKRGDGSVAEVERLLNSGSKSVETVAMRVLVKMGTSRSLGVAIPKILVEPYGDSRSNLLKVFGNVRSSAISGVVADIMAGDQSAESRKICKEILTAMEGGEVVEALAQRMKGDKDPVMMGRCLDVLSSMTKPSNVAALENVLVADDREAVQAAAAGALAGVGDGKACLILAAHAETNLFCRTALGEVRSPYAQKTLMEITSGIAGGDVRSAAVKALGRFNTAETRNFLEATAEKENDRQVLEAIKGVLSGGVQRQ